MSDKPSPVDDLKEGLGLLFRAAKTAAGRLPTGKIEDVAKDAAKEVGRAFESLGSELDKVLGKPTPPSAAPDPGAQADAAPSEAAPSSGAVPEEGAGPESPRGPRVG